LRQLARETHSKLRPPSGLRLAPRAAAIFEEIHEERLVGPAPPIRESARTAPPAALEQIPAAARSVENFTPPIAPPRQSLPIAPSLEDRRFQPARERHADTAPLVTPKPAPPKSAEAPWMKRQETREAPASPISEHRTAPAPQDQPPARPASAKAEPRSAVSSQPSREIHREILESTLHSEYFLDDVRPSSEEPRSITEFGIPEPVRTWLRLPPEKPASSPTRAQPPVLAPQPAPRRISPPVIDVTIGKIEVTIENEPRPPLRTVRRAEPRAAAPPRPASPAIGRLARQYLDR
jgi:hypothetical protein